MFRTTRSFGWEPFGSTCDSSLVEWSVIFHALYRQLHLSPVSGYRRDACVDHFHTPLSLRLRLARELCQSQESQGGESSTNLIRDSLFGGPAGVFPIPGGVHHSYVNYKDCRVCPPECNRCDLPGNFELHETVLHAGVFSHMLEAIRGLSRNL